MIDYISGKIIELTPTRVVVDNAGIGYSMEISLQTYAMLENKSEAKVYVQRQLNQRDGTEVDYGFADKAEREVFRLVIGVSGVGASSARMILSSLTSEELQQAILSENVIAIKSVKGIGAKTAQRLVLELKDKFLKGGISSSELITVTNSAVDEAVEALQTLGFTKPNIEKALKNVLKETPSASVEELIKAALKVL